MSAVAMSDEIDEADEEKGYWYGITMTKKGFRPVIVRYRSKAPQGVELKEAPNLLTAQAEAEKACREAFDSILDKRRTATINPESPEEIVAGSVARYVDGDSEHWSVVLKVNTNGDAVCVLFSSNPIWSKAYRRATKEEIALTGFVTSRPTYLASAVRPVNCFISTGVNFPLDRCEKLYAEFFKNSRESKQSKL